MEHGDGDDEGEVEPVRDVNVRLASAGQRADKDEEIDDPDDGEPKVDVPFGLRVFLGLGDAEQVAGGGEHYEKLVAPEHEPRSPVACQPRTARPLHHIK